MPRFDRFDVCEAWACFATLYHGGQWTTEYRILGRLEKIKFRPGAGHNDDPTRLTENGREIFDALVARKGFPPYTSNG